MRPGEAKRRALLLTWLLFSVFLEACCVAAAETGTFPLLGRAFHAPNVASLPVAKPSKSSTDVASFAVKFCLLTADLTTHRYHSQGLAV